MKRIGVLTSGGDAPGMNACIRAIVRTAIYHGMTPVGIERGFWGLIEDQMHDMDLRSVGDIINRGGTILKTARCLEFKTKEGQAVALENIRRRGIEGVVVIGGDGSFQGAQVLTNYGIPAIGIPGTIDNDLAYTDYTLGFDTALNTILDAIRKIRDTMTSHDRVSVVEVMGNKCGDLALYSGLVGGAECIIIPERDWNIDDICATLLRGKERGKMASIVLLAEGCGSGHEISKVIEERTGMQARATVLGHIQRGGAPSARDTQLASMFGFYAVNLLDKGIGGQVVGIKDDQIFNMDIHEALKVEKEVNNNLYNLANVLSM
ncbi:MAG: 6-phosphofructokinase [Firmicutes bacterium]|nr:6-phosphofructokinase [Bacillota bacterium]